MCKVQQLPPLYQLWVKFVVLKNVNACPHRHSCCSIEKAMKGAVKHSDGCSGIEDWTRSGPLPCPFHNSPMTQPTPKAGRGWGGVGGVGTPRKPQCHGRSAFTSSVGYTYPAMTVSILWCGSQACLFFVNPLKVELDGKLRQKAPVLL